MKIKEKVYTQDTKCKPWFKLSEIKFDIQPDDIIVHAKTLGTILMEELNQYRVTINLPNEVIMLTNNQLINE